ncbi:MAG: hypothetical protein ABH884_01310 [Candidatus Komeilibacteria bacterium]
MDDFKNLNWPGWPLDDNPHGEEFDLPARKRMLTGSEMLLPFLRKHKKNMGENILEIGPFFYPLINPKEFPNINIFYWENDYHVLKYLSKKYKNKSVYPIHCDLNRIEGNSLLKLKLETQKYFRNINQRSISFDAVIISHVLNYIDYKLLLLVLKEFLRKDGLIFINNVVDYGLPAFFSDMRPKSIPSTIKSVKETGYIIMEKEIFESPNKKHQKNKRLILVAKSNG